MLVHSTIQSISLSFVLCNTRIQMIPMMLLDVTWLLGLGYVIRKALAQP